MEPDGARRLTGWKGTGWGRRHRDHTHLHLCPVKGARRPDRVRTGADAEPGLFQGAGAVRRSLKSGPSRGAAMEDEWPTARGTEVRLARSPTGSRTNCGP
nr:hypothetical protein GCM10010200_110630 [Actinomadura rugatobispora]